MLYSQIWRVRRRGKPRVSARSWAWSVMLSADFPVSDSYIALASSGARASRTPEKRCRPPYPLPLPESIAATPAANSSQDQHVGPHLQRIELVQFSLTALHRKC